MVNLNLGQKLFKAKFMIWRVVFKIPVRNRSAGKIVTNRKYKLGLEIDNLPLRLGQAVKEKTTC